MAQPVFTQDDFLAGRCKHVELGQPKEPRWSAIDQLNGLCTKDQVGSTKPEGFGESGTVDMESALEAAYARMGGNAAFTEWAADNPGMVYPLMIKLGLTELSKRETERPLHEYSNEELEVMSTAELARLMVGGAPKACPACGHKL